MTSSDRPVVALLESRLANELSRLVEKHGGAPLCVPAVQESQQLSPEEMTRLLDDLQARQYDLVIFMTGAAVSLLFERAEQLGRRTQLVTALRHVTTACRGPKPTAALRGFGVPPTLTARDPYTAAELIDALSGVDLGGRRAVLFHYGDRSATLAETLIARRVQLDEVWLYRWLLPSDTSALRDLVERMIAGSIDALGVTCQIQFRHLHAVARDAQRDGELVRALASGKVVVGAVGPTCSAVLQAYGIHPQVTPDHPKMGPLVLALLRHLQRNRPAPAAAPSALQPAFTH